jgi:peptidoglycan/LPS O-acetylase OafA/YrhL
VSSFLTTNQTSSMESRLAYRPDIDGLRALAVLLVVGFHAFPGMVKGGFIGVDIFFVISGFLISNIIYDGLDAKSFSFSDFYGRRIRRIFPPLIPVFLFCLAFGWFNLLPDEYAQLGAQVTGGAVFISNIILWNEVGYFDVAAEVKPLLHLWSLGIEEQFYIIWPLLLLTFWKWKNKLMVVVMALAIVMFSMNVMEIRSSPSAVFYLPQYRFWELLIGAMLAYTQRSRSGSIQLFIQKHCTKVAALGLALIVVALLCLTKESRFPGWWALLPTIGAALLIGAGGTAWFNKNILASKPLVSVGLISYSLYLWHWPLLSFLYIVDGPVPRPYFKVAAVLIAILLAISSFYLIEKPIRFGANKTKKTQALIGGMALHAFLGLGIFYGGGISSRIPERFVIIGEQFKRIPAGTSDCIKKYIGGGNSYCRISDISSPPTAVIIGDSHAGHFFWGLKDYYLKKGENLLNLGAGGCPPFITIAGANHPGIDQIDCSWYPKAFERIIKDKNIKTVILAFHHAEYFRDDIQIFYHSSKTQETNFEKAKIALIDTVKQLENSGKKVVLIYDMPDINIDIKQCFQVRPFERARPQCVINESVYKYSEMMQYQLLVKQLEQSTNITVFDTRPYVDGNFPIDKDGFPTYIDKTHLTKRGSQFLTDKFNF